MPVPRRGEVALELPDIELEVAERAGRAVEQVPVVKRAAAMLQAALPFDVFILHDLHRRLPRADVAHIGAILVRLHPPVRWVAAANALRRPATLARAGIVH